MLLLFVAPVGAITIEIYDDAACTISRGNSSLYTGWSGVCNTATAPDTGLSIGVDFCSPQAVNMSVFRSNAGEESWGGHFSCAAPAVLETRFSLELGACTPVFPCLTCPQQFFRLWDVQCFAPAPVLIVQHDRGVIAAVQQIPAALACSEQIQTTADGRMQSREVVSGLCNPPIVTGSPQCSWFRSGVEPSPVRQNCATGTFCGNEIPSCLRYDINSLSILPQPTPTGIVFSMFAGVTCTGTPVMTYPSMPVQGSASTGCTVVSGAPLPVTAQHGLRTYGALPYVTAFSATASTTPSPPPTPSLTPSASPSPSVSPTPSHSPSSAPAAPPGVAAALSTEQSIIVGVSVTAFVLICALAGGLAYVVLKLRAAPAPSASLGAWAQRTSKAPLPPLTPAVATTSPVHPAPPGAGHGAVQAWGEPSRL